MAKLLGRELISPCGGIKPPLLKDPMKERALSTRTASHAGEKYGPCRSERRQDTT